MTKRRANGEGTISLRGKNIYRLRVTVGRRDDGRVIQASRTVHATSPAAARKQLRDFLHDLDRGKVERPVAARLFRDAYEEWLAHLARIGRADGTLDSYRQTARRLFPAFGDRTLTAITAYQLDQYYATCGLAARTVRRHHATISSFYAQAIKWGWATTNPAQGATPPAEPRGVKPVPTPDQIRRLLDIAAGNQELLITVTLAGLLGARRGELAGLRWEDVDWHAATVTITRQRKKAKGGERTLPLKHGDQRTVHVGAYGIEALTAWRLHTADTCAAAGIVIDPAGWIISRDGGWAPLRAERVANLLSDLAEKAGARFTTHAFRRFAATQLVGAGVDIRTVATRLGHTPETLFKAYAGDLAEKDRAAGLTLGQILGNIPATEEG